MVAQKTRLCVLPTSFCWSLYSSNVSWVYTNAALLLSFSQLSWKDCRKFNRWCGWVGREVFLVYMVEEYLVWSEYWLFPPKISRIKVTGWYSRFLHGRQKVVLFQVEWCHQGLIQTVYRWVLAARYKAWVWGSKCVGLLFRALSCEGVGEWFLVERRFRLKPCILTASGRTLHYVWIRHTLFTSRSIFDPACFMSRWWFWNVGDKRPKTTLTGSSSTLWNWQL